MKTLLIPVFIISLAALLPCCLFSQGKVGINTTTPAAMLHVKDSSVVFTGINPLPASPGNPPVIGPGTRMMWYSNKASFRAGRITGLHWEKDSIGLHSVGLGFNTKAIGESSFAAGSSTTARGNRSMAIGVSTIATGDASMAMGNSTSATGFTSVAFGESTLASGIRSAAFGGLSVASGANSFASGFGTNAFGHFTAVFGLNIKSKSYGSFALGAFNDTTSTSSNSWVSTDPLFMIGNGLNENNRSNAVTVLKNGNTGIGTISPQKLLHVRGGSSGATFSAAADIILEDDEDVVINLLTPAANASGIFFGNNLSGSHGGILYNAESANGLGFRTNGNLTRAVITDTGDFGIGDNSPNSRLHISEGTGGGFYNMNAEVIIEDDDQAYIQFSVPTSEESGILSGNSVSSMRSGVLFRADSSLQIRSGGNTTRLVATTAGDIGINTLSPGAKLDVNGTAIIGSNGTALSEIIKTTVAKDVASIAANTSLNVDFTVPNCATTSAVYVSPGNDLTAGMIIAYARVTAAATVRVRFTNTTGAAIDLPNMNYYIAVIR